MMSVAISIPGAFLRSVSQTVLNSEGSGKILVSFSLFASWFKIISLSNLAMGSMVLSHLALLSTRKKICIIPV